MLKRSKHGSPVRTILTGLFFTGLGYAAMHNGHIVGGALVFLLGLMIVITCIWIDHQSRAHNILKKRKKKSCGRYR